MLAAKKNDRNLDLLLIQNCEQEITKLDIDVKKKLTDLLSLEKNTTQQQLTTFTREIKSGLAQLEEKIAQLERLAGKWNFRGEDGEALREELKCHRDELAKNQEHLRINTLRATKTIDEQSRKHLFEQNIQDVELRRRTKNHDDMLQKSHKTTDSLSKLVSQMGEQLKLSEETTTTLIHSSNVLQETEQQLTTMGSTIKSGGKLLAKYGRRECTDKILIVLALLFYFGVVMYILRKRVFPSLF
uniref:Vesicle transport protein SEC20 n=1 Tax=Steinernema glaseri TaxID=37863 RepID=A0A1I7ZG92_9BILA